jgi:hypothetical protein
MTGVFMDYRGNSAYNSIQKMSAKIIHENSPDIKLSEKLKILKYFHFRKMFWKMQYT